MFDGKVFGEEIVAVIKAYLDKQLDKIFKRIEDSEKRFVEGFATIPSVDEAGIRHDMLALEKRFENDMKEYSQYLKELVASVSKSITEIPKIEPIEFPEVPTAEDFKSMIADEVTKSVAAIPPAKDGKDGTSVNLYEVEEFVSMEVAKAIAAIPIPKDGKDGENGKDGAPGKDGKDGKDGEDGLDGEDGRDGVDGKSFNLEECLPVIAEEVTKAISTIPLPKDGKDGLNGENGKDGVDGKDGVGLGGALIDRSGELIMTMTNGSTKNLGPVVGANGKDGAPGKDGKDGAPGKDGVDGLGFDDMSSEIREDGLYLIWSKGNVIKEARLPSINYRGVWSEDIKVKYSLGDAVTWGGSLWIAMKDLPLNKPDTVLGKDDWRLAVKRGADGKNGRDGKDAILGTMVNKGGKDGR